MSEPSLPAARFMTTRDRARHGAPRRPHSRRSAGSPLAVPSSRSSEFVAVAPAAEPASSTLPTLVAAYVLMWLLLLASSG